MVDTYKTLEQEEKMYNQLQSTIEAKNQAYQHHNMHQGMDELELLATNGAGQETKPVTVSCSLQQLGDPTVDSAAFFANNRKQMKDSPVFVSVQNGISANFKATAGFESLIIETGFKLPKICVRQDSGELSTDSTEPQTDINTPVHSNNDDIVAESEDDEMDSDDDADEIDFDNLKPEYDLSRGNYRDASTLKIAIKETTIVLGKRTSRRDAPQGAQSKKRARFQTEQSVSDFDSEFFGSDESEMDDDMLLLNFEPLGPGLTLQRANAVEMLNQRNASLYI